MRGRPRAWRPACRMRCADPSARAHAGCASMTEARPAAGSRGRVSAMTDPQSSAVATFHALHASGCFVMPNPWDAGSAIFLQQLGYRALATTSAGFGFSRGQPDEMSALGVDAVIDHVRDLSRATPLPLNADFQSGYAPDADGVAANVTRCVRAGAAGLSIEDATGDAAAPLYERSTALERLRAARQAIDASGVPAVLTARCEAYLLGVPDARRVAL